MHALVILILLYAFETWFQRLLGFSFRDDVANEELRNSIRQAIGPYEVLITTVRKRKLRWHGHITRSIGLAKDDPAGHGTRREKERPTEKEMGGQHIIMDRIRVG